ncbi:MAG: hypothetical protein GC151_04645 [Betaproteobacteria bacterium]|nr:hypothetical protein [Betaproteobacteria bacterium]
MRAALAILIAVFALWSRVDAEPFTFAVTGDTPYSEGEREAFVSMLAGMNDAPLAFVVHIGDFKNGYSDCSDDLYRDRQSLFGQSRHPFVLIPGDNDWTDCGRFVAGHRDPEERLARLRSLFFSRDTSLGQRTLPLARQRIQPNGCCPENVRWWHAGVLFLGLHVVGSDNHYGPGRTPTREFVRRRDATIAWIEEGFGEAVARDAAAVVVFLHADMNLERLRHHGRGFDDIVDALTAAFASFGGPVLLVHGDTHRFRIDSPPGLTLATPGQTVIRLETYGSPVVGWVGVTVTPGQRNPFSFHEGRR